MPEGQGEGGIDAVASVLKKTLLNPRVLEVAIERVVARLVQPVDTVDSAQELAAVESQLAHLTAAAGCH